MLGWVWDKGWDWWFRCWDGFGIRVGIGGLGVDELWMNWLIVDPQFFTISTPTFSQLLTFRKHHLNSFSLPPQHYNLSPPNSTNNHTITQSAPPPTSITVPQSYNYSAPLNPHKRLPVTQPFSPSKLTPFLSTPNQPLITQSPFHL